MSLTPVLPRFTRYPDYRFQIGEVLKEPYHETLAALDDRRQGDGRVQSRSEALRRPRVPAQRARPRVRGRRRAQRRRAEQRDRLGRAVSGRRQAGRRPQRSCGARAPAQAHWLAVNQQLNPVAADNADARVGAAEVRLRADAAEQRHVQVRLAPEEDRPQHPERQDRRRRQRASRCPPTSPATSCWCCATAPARAEHAELQRRGPGEPVALARAQRRAAGSARQARLQRRRHD